MQLRLVAAQNSFELCLQIFNHQLERFQNEGATLAPEVAKEARTLIAALQTLFNESEKLERLTSDLDADGMDAGIDLDAARAEILGRIDRLRERGDPE